MPNLEHVSPVMSQCATLEGLRQNPFRIFGLRVDLTGKELAEAIKDLGIQMEFGAELPHAFALGTTGAGMLAQANQRLRDPVQRLCDECFWFWPMDLGAQDVALDLVAAGDKAGAKAAWREFLGHPDWGPIAAHNLAILDLYESFDDSTELERFGTGAKDFLGSPVCVNRIKARLRTIPDPRLPRNAAQGILEEMRRAMASNQIRIGLERISEGDTVRGFRNIRCARNIADSEELHGALAEEQLRSDLRRLEARNAIDVEQATESDWKSLAQECFKLIDRMQPFPSLAGRVQIIGNNTARTLRGISIHIYNERNQRRKALEIAELARKLAYGDLLQKINDDIKAVNEGIESEKSDLVFGPLRARLDNLAKLTGEKQVVSEARSILAAINSGVNEGHSKLQADVLYHNLGWLMRSKAIEANNTYNDVSGARLYLSVAQEVVRDSENRGLRQDELKVKLLQDFFALNRYASAQHNGWAAPTPARNDSCLVPLVALLCLAGAAGYAAPATVQTVRHLLQTLLP